jgi:2-polyprenyl-3-methyl-5-hydroxy-6-metoxy-1,4-benzoquinol methylase
MSLEFDDAKRRDNLSPQQVQEGNRTWWTRHPMAYDWHGEIDVPRFSEAWFQRVDERFIHGARLFATHREPFDRIIPFDRLAGKAILEIGCGMGLHTELMTRAGGKVTAIDLSETSIQATTRRLELRGLKANIQHMDAERLEFDSDSFDLVWSWGVIHHSARTAWIAREIARVLRPSGECRVMVYNREGMPAKLAYLKHVLSGEFLRRSYEETLFDVTDGFSARYYVRDQFEDLFRAFFKDVHTDIVGQEADAVPLPRRLRSVALRVLPQSYLETAQARFGGFIFLTATHPY